MQRILLNISACTVVIISFIVNSYLLALFSTIIYSLSGIFLHLPSKSFNFFLVLGSCLILILLGIGLLNMPFLFKIITNSRAPFKKEHEKINSLFHDVLSLLKSGKTLIQQRQQFNFDTIFNLSKYTILIANDIYPNASSYGTNTIIIEKILLTNFSDDEIKAVLLHEMSHLIYKDSLITLGIYWINLPLQVITWLCHKYTQLALNAFKNFKGNFFSILLLLPLIIFSPLIMLNLIGRVFLNLTFMLIRRMFEHAADKFVVNYGYRDALLSFLEKQLLLENNLSIIDRLVADHPSIAKRISRLES